MSDQPGVKSTEIADSPASVKDLTPNRTILALPLTVDRPADKVTFVDGKELKDFVPKGGVPLLVSVSEPGPAGTIIQTQGTIAFGADDPARILEDMDLASVVGKVMITGREAEGPIRARPLLELRIKELLLGELLKVLDKPGIGDLIARKPKEVESLLQSWLVTVKGRIESARQAALIEAASRSPSSDA